VDVLNRREDLSYAKIFHCLWRGGFVDAIEYLERNFIFQRIKFDFNHWKVLLLLFFMGTLEKPLTVPKEIKVPYGSSMVSSELFWKVIEWLYEGSVYLFKTKYDDLKRNTIWVGEREDAYYITLAGAKIARKLIINDARCKTYFLSLIKKIYDDTSSDAIFFKEILASSGNFHPIEKEKLSLIVKFHKKEKFLKPYDISQS